MEDSKNNENPLKIEDTYMQAESNKVTENNN